MKAGEIVTFLQLYEFATKKRFHVYILIANCKSYAHLHNSWLKNTRVGKAKVSYSPDLILKVIWVELIAGSF